MFKNNCMIKCLIRAWCSPTKTEENILKELKICKREVRQKNTEWKRKNCCLVKYINYYLIIINIILARVVSVSLLKQ